MERVLRIGGYFLRAADPVALGAWYRECLGLDADEHGLWRQEAGATVFATFEAETDYFGSRTQQIMLNLRVRDLDAMLAQLRANGAAVAILVLAFLPSHPAANRNPRPEPAAA
jgi:Glyoxalase-like domain